MVEQKRKVVHLEIKESNVHEYYGSLVSLFKEHDADEIGYSLSTLHRMKLSENNPYIGEKVIIRIGRLK